MRVLIKEIGYCIECPYMDCDINLTRNECTKSKRKFISWSTGDVNEYVIPEWCTLIESDNVEINKVG